MPAKVAKCQTVNQLHKALGKLIEQGHGRRRVAVAKDTFRHNCEGDGVTIIDVEGLTFRSILFWNNDTDSCENADGTERTRLTCVLHGGAYDPMNPGY